MIFFIKLNKVLEVANFRFLTLYLYICTILLARPCWSIKKREKNNFYRINVKFTFDQTAIKCKYEHFFLTIFVIVTEAKKCST